VPRAKYAKPPGPFPAVERIKRAKFRFRNEQWRKLSKLLPGNLANLVIAPAEAAKVPLPLRVKIKTVADFVIVSTEEAINSHLTGRPLIADGQTNPANNLVAVRWLRHALKPFVNGSVDDETASIIPADLDDKLAVRERQLMQLRAKPTSRRALAMLCQVIGVYVRQSALANGETVSKEEMLRFIDAALSFARIPHPHVVKHRARLIALIFPD
jgi:hypothetical protein